ncbi:amidohydrolase family protein [Sphingobacterium sp. HJSM2_6]|uniref:amidohydrolase family protein n=1 Tax=Sphingobacterium sp. HJSM2_6 TaxID=3366264 RepID=UPI003BCFF7F1
MISTNKPLLENFKLIDAHIHFWNVNSLHYPWLITVPELNKSFELNEFYKETKQVQIDKLIFIQAECLPELYVKEIEYIQELAALDPRIVAIIPYFPLEEKDAKSLLEKLTENTLIKGIRRLEEEPITLYGNTAFMDNFPLLAEFNLTFDLGIKAHQLNAAIQLVDKFPHQKFILDHAGKPPIKFKEINNWKSQIKALSSNPNVYCKLSGLITESDLINWKAEDLKPYVDYLLEMFGTNRIAFGSDWPVVTLGATYQTWLSCAFELCDHLNSSELQQIFYQNALDFYQLES